MDIESEFHIASQISSEAETETLDSYEDRIHHYENKRYTYIPMPDDGRYYNTKEGWLNDFKFEQRIGDEEHLLDVLRGLQKYPFLLIDYLFSRLVPISKEQAEEASITDTFTFDDHPGVDENQLFVLFPKLELHFPEEAAKVQEERGYSEEGRYEIITLVDVNRRPVKEMLYKILSELAATLSQQIEHKYADSELILHHLNPSTIGYWWKDNHQGLDIHVAEHMNLLEMKKVIQSSEGKLVESCGFTSKKDVETLNSINNVRNRVMHANRSLIYDRHDIQDVLDVISNAERIINNAE